MRRFLVFLFLLHCLLAATSQQTIGFTLPEGKRKVTFDFELYNNLIVIPVKINGFLEVKFILDTGAEATILTEKAFGDVVGLNYVRTINITGPGIVDLVEAYVATHVDLGLPRGVKGTKMSMLVLKEDYLQLKENLGDEIYGIIGYDLFNRFVVEVNYDRMKLTLYDPRTFKARKKTPTPLTFTGTKPFINASIRQEEKSSNVKLLIDTGASHPLLLDVYNTDSLAKPTKTIDTRLGQGIGGEIPGYVGRIESLDIQDLNFEDVLVSIPKPGVYSDAIKRGSRHGTIGGELLRRLHPIFDYSKDVVYFKKGSDYREKFEFDMSGLILGVKSSNADSIVVRKVEASTPAAGAGIEEGDSVLFVNGEDLRTSKLSEINGLLRKRDGARMKVVLWRDRRYVTKKFRLQKRI